MASSSSFSSFGLSVSGVSLYPNRFRIIEMLRTTRRELENAYRAHLSACNPCSSSSQRLLLCYAVECGLKVLIMRNNNVQSSSELAEEFQIGHDIREGLKRCYAPARLTTRQTNTRHRQGAQETVHPKHLHQAFRYGIPVDSEGDITAELQQIRDWLKERLG